MADRDAVLRIVSNAGGLLQFAASDLKLDREIVLAACRQNGMALEFAQGGDLFGLLQRQGGALGRAEAEEEGDREAVQKHRAPHVFTAGAHTSRDITHGLL